MRGQFALVSQDVVMLNDSLAANITLGQTLDMQRLEACIDAANLNDVVRGLPDGVETQLGHNATQLSGGQRQRLAIARALYKDAPILLLDEATSALDNASERLVQEAMTRLMKGRTTLIVAHRLSTIEHADRVIVMADGEIKEDGTHATLMQAGGLYTHLHQRLRRVNPRRNPPTTSAIRCRSARVTNSCRLANETGLPTKAHKSLRCPLSSSSSMATTRG